MNGWSCVAGLLGAFAIVAACSSDDNANGTTSGGSPDGGSSTSSSSSGAGTSSSSSSSSGGASGTGCFGKTFIAPVAVTANVDGGADTRVEQVRVVGTAAVFARTDTGSAPTYIWESDYGPADDGAPPSLGGVSTNIVDPHVGESDLAPTLASDASFIVFTHGEIGARILWSALKSGPVYGNAGSANISTGTTDDADPYLSGAPTATLWFGQGQVDGTAMKIASASVTVNSGADPTFGTVTPLTLTCPGGATDNCGKPVVTADEKTLFYASWSAGLTSTNYAMHEIALAKDGTGHFSTTGAAVDHAELGGRAVSWVSADGCQVLLDGGLENSGVFYASRSSK